MLRAGGGALLLSEGPSWEEPGPASLPSLDALPINELFRGSLPLRERLEKGFLKNKF